MPNRSYEFGAGTVRTQTRIVGLGGVMGSASVGSGTSLQTQRSPNGSNVKNSVMRTPFFSTCVIQSPLKSVVGTLGELLGMPFTFMTPFVVMAFMASFVAVPV